MIKRAGWLALVLLAAWAQEAQAGPPFVTDDPEPVELHAWEINYGATYAHAAGSSSGALPGVDLNYGVAPNVQLHAQPQLAYVHGSDGHSYGLGDLELGVKYRFTAPDQPSDGWMVGVYPMLELPTGSARRGLGAGSHSIYLPLWLQTTRGNWTFFGGGGYWLDNGDNARNTWAGGATLLYQISERLQFGGELYGSGARTVDGRTTLGANLGGVYQLEGGMALLFSAGHGLKNASTTNQGALYLGLRTTY
jgi:hypothetical protein